MKKQGVLLVNLGSPDSPSTSDVRKYLREFLMDERVIDVAWPLRFWIVHACILPFRPAQSAEAYKSIWRKEGSPLILISRRVAQLLQERLPIPVELAMRYQNPSIEVAVANLLAAGVEEIISIPLFPHYAMSSYETAVERVKKIVRDQDMSVHVSTLPPYYRAPEYINALIASATPYLEEGYDHLLFSFHGVPERQIKKSDPTGCHCLKVKDCCFTPSPAHATCYRAQCFQTALEFVRHAGIPEGKFSIAFQSRLGRDPWLSPSTDAEIARLAKEGCKKLLVICPAFVSDCLETLEEIAIRGRETFQHAGGETLTQIPCLNDHPAWIDALEQFVHKQMVTVGLDLAPAKGS